MLSRFKFMKPLGNHLPAASKLAAFGGCLLAIAVGSAPARAADDDKASCEQELPGFFQVVENLKDEKKADPEKIDDSYVAENCNDSDRSEVNKSLTTRVNGTDLGGACRSAHLLIREHYKELKTAHADYCEQVEKSAKASDECLGKDSKEDISSCLTQMRDQLAEIKAKHKIVIKIAEASKELTAARDQNKKVFDKFIEDKHKFDLGNPSENDLVAMKGFASEDDYRKLLQTDFGKPVPRNVHNSKVSEGALIDEQRLASDNITHYLASLDLYKKKKAAGEDKVNEQITALSKKAKENNSEDKGLGKYATAAATAAPAAQSLMKPNTSASSSSGPGISGAVAALPAAAALIGAAKSNSGASSATPTSPTGTVPGSHETPTTTLGGGTAVATGNRAPASNNPNELKTNATETKKDEATGGFSPMNLSSDGSSRMGTMKKGQKNAEESSGPAQATSYANNGVDMGGGMSMNSHGGSHGSTPAPGTEVTNLLGQMKSLFNFDDPAGTGGGGNGGVFGGAMPGMAPGMPGSGEAAPEAGSWAENGSASPDAVASNGEVSTVEQGSAPENLTDSLFVRVHKRHRRAQERGMVRGV